MEIRFSEAAVCFHHIMNWENRLVREKISMPKTSGYYRLGYLWQGICRMALYDPDTGKWGEERCIRPGEFWYIPPGVWYRTESSDDLHNTNIFFSYSTADFPIRKNDIEPASLTLGYREKIQTCPRYRFTDMPLLSDVFIQPDSFDGSAMVRQMMEEWDVRYRYGREILDHMMALLLLYLNRHRSFGSGTGSRKAAEQALAYISEHYHEKLTCQQIAAELGYHPNYLNTIIREATGISFHKYIMDTKLRHARRLVNTTDMSVGEIAAALAFNDASHFTNIYTRYTGMSPTAQRRRSRGENPEEA